MAEIHKEVNMENEHQKPKVKPSILCIVSFLLITLLLYIVKGSSIPFISKFAVFYFYPFTKVEFSHSIWMFVTAVVLAFVSMMILGLSTEPKSKPKFYFYNFLLTYTVYAGIVILAKTAAITIEEISSGNYGAIFTLVVSIVLIIIQFVVHISSVGDMEVYEKYFIKESERYKERVKLEQEEEERISRLRKKSEEEAKREAEFERRKADEAKKKKHTYNASNFEKDPISFKEDDGLADKITSNLEDVSKDKQLSFDTNVMIKCPLMVRDLSKQFHIIISKKVLEELDKKKKDNEIGSNARMAMRTIEAIQLDKGNITIVNIDEQFLLDHAFNPSSPDDVIIGAYLKQKMNGEKLLFISEDRGARITARSFDLEVLNF